MAYWVEKRAPELVNIANEPAHIHKLYGLDNKDTAGFGRQCLLARRLVERGVRFVELTIPMVDGYQRWDAHNNLVKNHRDNAKAVDQPIAALIQDLKQRGLLDETLVVWGKEKNSLVMIRPAVSSS